MKCASGKEKHVDFLDLVKCETCDMKVARDVAAIMYIAGKDFFFCSHNCQDKWEEQNPDKLW